jgi:hypothetical protein
MKKVSLILISLLLLSSFSQIAEGQITKDFLNGMWQGDRPDIGSGYGELYYFYMDGSFSYHPSEMDGLKRIHAIKGLYELNGEELILTTTSLEESKGGNVERVPFIPANDSWIIDYDEVIEVELEPKEHFLTIKIHEDEFSNKPSILIDNRPFYRLN